VSDNESTVSNRNKLFAASIGGKLMRNNNGVSFRIDGAPVRFGLGNESAKIHESIYRSSDQIGITPILITADMVGQTIGVFTAVEDKKEGWKRSPTDKHEQLQDNFLQMVIQRGGIACFATKPDDFAVAILNFHKQFSITNGYPDETQ